MAKPHIKLRASADGMRVGASTYVGVGGGAFHGASYAHRDVSQWFASRGSADADLLPDRDELVYRNRDIHRNNGVAHAGVQTIVDNVVGTGLRLSSRPNWQALGRTKEWAIEWGTVAESWFHAWWHSTACHAGDTLTGDQLTVQVAISKANNGASLTLPLWLPKRGDGFATKLRTVEVDRLCQPYGVPETPTFRQGIEFDDFGMPLAYHIRKAHPGDRYTLDPREAKWERVPRRTAHGRLRVIHDFDSERPDQSQGIPLMAAILPQFKNLDRYIAAEIQAAVMNAMIFGVMKTPLSADEIVDMYSKDPELWLRQRDERVVKMQSGSMIALSPGDELESFMPQRPASGFGTFVENVYRIIAVGLDMPYELLLKDFTKTNYSSARAAMLEAWRSFNRKRDWLGTMWLDPIYALFVEELVNDGRIDAPDFYSNRAHYLRCRWIGPGKGWVDPVKEAQAAQLRIESGVSTLEDECAEQGKDWREVLEQQAREQETRKELGVEMPVKAAPGQQPTEDAANDPNAEERAAARANIAAMQARLESMHTELSALFNRPQLAPPAPVITVNAEPPAPAATTIDTGEPRRTLLEHEVLEVDHDGLPSKVRQTYAMPDAKQPPPAPEPKPAAGTVLREVVKEVVERDADGRILKTREVEIAV